MAGFEGNLRLFEPSIIETPPPSPVEIHGNGTILRKPDGTVVELAERILPPAEILVEESETRFSRAFHYLANLITRSSDS